MSTIYAPAPPEDGPLRLPSVSPGRSASNGALGSVSGGGATGTLVLGIQESQVGRFHMANEQLRNAQPQIVRELEATLAYVEAHRPESAADIRSLLTKARQDLVQELDPQFSSTAKNGERISGSLRDGSATFELCLESLQTFKRDQLELRSRLETFRESVRGAVDAILGCTPRQLAVIREGLDAVVGGIFEAVSSAADLLRESVVQAAQQQALPAHPMAPPVLPKIPEEASEGPRRERLEERRESSRPPSIHDTKTILDVKPSFQADFLIQRTAMETPILTPPLYREHDEIIRAREDIARRLEARGKHIQRDLQGRVSQADHLDDLESLMLTDCEASAKPVQNAAPRPEL